MAHNLLNFWIALIVFIAHIIGNLIVTKPNPELFNRLEKLTLFPPSWVFIIWFVIWILQSVLFYQTYNSEFWSNTTTLLFLLVCIGNLGSQYAGANNYGWFVYILFISCMLVSSILFMEKTSVFYSTIPIAKSASQIYVGWASLAFLVGLGVILVTDQKVINDHTFTLIGSVLLFVVPIGIWTLWFTGKGDYRTISFPYFLLYFAFGLRIILR
jgi:hypothetical protein